MSAGERKLVEQWVAARREHDKSSAVLMQASAAYDKASTEHQIRSSDFSHADSELRQSEVVPGVYLLADGGAVVVTGNGGVFSLPAVFIPVTEA
ncbi:MAG: hypothetical protein ABL982_03480 [Vicinamibacterales bacterium]